MHILSAEVVGMLSCILCRTEDSHTNAVSENYVNEEIVVSAIRWKPPPDQTDQVIDRETIETLGAETIIDAIKIIDPTIGQDGDDIIYLVNGKPAGFDTSILSFPPGALNNISILKAGTGAEYGGSGSSKVINFDVKNSFESLSGSLGAIAARSGVHSVRSDLSMHSVRGNFRLQVALNASLDNKILAEKIGQSENSHDIPDCIAPSDANVSTCPSMFFDAGDKTLLPRRKQFGASVGVSFPLGDFSTSLNVNVQHSEQSGHNGLLSFSKVHSCLSECLKLNSGSTVTSVNSTGSVSGSLYGIRGNVSLVHSFNKSSGYFSSLNNSAVLGNDEIDINQSMQNINNFTVRTNLSTQVINLLAGPVTATIYADHMWNDSNISNKIGEIFNRKMKQGTAILGFNIPISNGSVDPSNPIGKLSIDLGLSRSASSRDRPQLSKTLNVNWSPIDDVNAVLSVNHRKVNPGYELLDSSIVTEMRGVFDHYNNLSYLVPFVRGGNDNLVSSKAIDVAARLEIKPLKTKNLSINFNYNQSAIQNGLVAVPVFTPQFEKFYPERVVRSGDGRILQIDARPYNFHQASVSSLGVSLNLFHVFTNVGTNDQPALNLSAFLSFKRELTNEFIHRSGYEATNLLLGGGLSRNSVQFQSSLVKRGLGLSLNATWNDKATLYQEGDLDTIYEVNPPFLLNIGFFIEPQFTFARINGPRILSNLKLSLDIQNLLDDYRKTSQRGAPNFSGGSRYEIDPLGRTIKFSARKQF